MDRVSTTTGIGTRPVVYAGRFADRVGAGLPDDCPVLDEWDVLPARLTGVLDRATDLVILDLFSFPFEAMTGEQWDVPLVCVLPPEFDAGFLATVFGEVLFGRLGFFDRVATGNPALWEDLSRRYRWTGSQRIRLESEHPGEAAAEVHAVLEAERAVPDLEEVGRYEAYRYWSERGDALASSAPQKAIRASCRGPEKAVHRVQAAALEPQFAAARGDRATDVPFDVLEVGVGVGRWAASFDPTVTRFVGADVSEGMVEAARANFPEARFDQLDPGLLLPYEDESFDLVFTVTVLHHNPAPAKRTLLSEIWRVTRPGGRLLFLEDFVAERRSPGSTVYPMSVLRFVELLLEATGGQVALEHVESLRYPRDDVVRSAVVALSRLGVPKKW
jgi:SAM-dependent methyltransferase